MKQATPMRVIKAKCYDCSNFQYDEVKLCTVTDCPLYDYRLGHKPKNGTPAFDKWLSKAETTRYQRVSKRKGIKTGIRPGLQCSSAKP